MTASARRRISVTAVMPGTKNGMTLMTQRIVNDMRQRYDVRLCDIGGGYRRSDWRWRVRKAWQSFQSGLRIATWSADPGECLYVPVNSHGGLLYNVWQFAMGRMRGFQIVAHHHGWSYLYARDRRMDWLLTVAGRDAIHVLACPEMLHDLQTVYQREVRSAFVTPGVVGPAIADSAPQKPASKSPRRFRVGMLSNLMISKGVGEAIDTFECLRANDRDVELHLGGPIRDPEAGQRIESAIARHGDRVRHLGPIYDAAKDDFYRGLDVFIFPTLYRNESWGIVLNEALMAGVPVATYQRGCTGYLVGDAGLVVPAGGGFPKLAAEQIEVWMDDPAQFESARVAASRRGQELGDEAETQLRLFLDAFETGHWPPLPPLSTCQPQKTAMTHVTS